MSTKMSTSALAKKREQSVKSLFEALSLEGLIIRHDDHWQLTDKGSALGGEYRESEKFGQYIVWPETVEATATPQSTSTLLTATAMGERFTLAPAKVNQILNELGWIDRAEQGWTITDAGRRAGGIQKENSKSASSFVLWAEEVMVNSSLKQSVRALLGKGAEQQSTDNSISSFRQKFEAKHRTTDGHYVRSKAEMLIDNWLYMAGLVHAYERKLPVEEEAVCDFYLPGGKIYIEYLAADADSEKQQQKQRIYQKYQFNLIELDDNEVQNLDYHLRIKLHAFGIKAY
jgi:hypothetical protein